MAFSLFDIQFYSTIQGNFLSPNSAALLLTSVLGMPRCAKIVLKTVFTVSADQSLTTMASVHAVNESTRININPTSLTYA